MIECLYHPTGYIDMGAVMAAPYPYIIITGARGIGKTYGTLRECMDRDGRFLYLRRTAKILEIITDPATHSFKKINANTGREVLPKAGSDRGEFWEGDRLIGYAGALSVIANLRGVDFSDVDILIYDEFIPEPGERVMFDAFRALTNAIETVGRNRELEGLPPLKVLLMSNSDLIYSDIVAGFGIGDHLRYMQNNAVEQLEVSKDMLLIRPLAEVFRDQKMDTALYRVTAGSDFAAVALDNKFPFEDESRIGRRPLKEYKPICTIRGICIYQHKSNGRYYVCKHISGRPTAYDNTEADLRRFLRENIPISKAYMRREVDFEGINVQTVFRRIFTL